MSTSKQRSDSAEASTTVYLRGQLLIKISKTLEEGSE